MRDAAPRVGAWGGGSGAPAGKGEAWGGVRECRGDAAGWGLGGGLGPRAIDVQLRVIGTGYSVLGCLRLGRTKLWERILERLANY